MNQTNMPVILASASVRRQSLLSQLIDGFEIAPANIDETPHINEDAQALVRRLGLEKAQSVLKKYASPNCVVIGSDTVVAIDNTILGKPQDFEDFSSMMRQLSNSTHYVHTSIAVVTAQRTLLECVSTQVHFSSITALEIQQYWDSHEPKDKAGGYAIQGIGGQFVKSISGSYSAVVGLPLQETKHLLREMGVIA